MEIIVRQNTVSLIQAFRQAHNECLWQSGKSNAAALNGMLMLVNTFLSHERNGGTLMIDEALIPNAAQLEGARVQDLATGTKYIPFTMKEQFALSAKALSEKDAGVCLVAGGEAGELASVHHYLKTNGILPQDSTQGQALDVVARLACGLIQHKHGTVTGISLKNKSGKILPTSVLI